MKSNLINKQQKIGKWKKLRLLNRLRYVWWLFDIVVLIIYIRFLPTLYMNIDKLLSAFGPLLGTILEFTLPLLIIPYCIYFIEKKI
ncbi:hypothetical protein [Breznakia pachnodae]|uniref:Uncharacterized protein n=1 Tax=Breznakia pachnodae TaxID=265178 RepID=A0ABU0E4G6_9FIRM|nr:hypothetical protein [Breznakia pachnodae]MDQ0361611.1 hypothetical protein [Breznakia pachnodae]